MYLRVSFLKLLRGGKLTFNYFLKLQSVNGHELHFLKKSVIRYFNLLLCLKETDKI